MQDTLAANLDHRLSGTVDCAHPTTPNHADTGVVDSSLHLHRQEYDGC